VDVLRDRDIELNAIEYDFVSTNLSLVANIDSDDVSLSVTRLRFSVLLFPISYRLREFK
jgi:hypothetical protein